jgi:hypothetical protein
VKFYLSFGEQAPFKGSPEKVDHMTADEIEFWLEKMKETYEEQQAALDRAHNR